MAIAVLHIDHDGWNVTVELLPNDPRQFVHFGVRFTARKDGWTGVAECPGGVTLEAWQERHILPRRDGRYSSWLLTDAIANATCG